IESLEKLAAVEIVINIDGHEESKRMLFQEDLPHLYFGLVNFGTVEVVEETNLKNIHSDCALLINPDAMTLVMRVFYKKLIELAGEENNSVQKQVEDFLITMFLDELVRRFNADPEKKDLDEAIRQEIFKQFKEFVTEEVKELVRHQKKH
ncbi:MAG: hypothetical protein HYS98_02465, partial [Deltaproteobacteria bacterium]|nr:hypothetical protein [Deltaproteobacteria bacterium]